MQVKLQVVFIFLVFFTDNFLKFLPDEFSAIKCSHAGVTAFLHSNMGFKIFSQLFTPTSYEANFSE